MDQDMKTKQSSGIPRRVFSSKSSAISTTDINENPPSVNTRSNTAALKSKPIGNLVVPPIRHLKPINETKRLSPEVNKISINKAQAKGNKVGTENKDGPTTFGNLLPTKMFGKKSGNSSSRSKNSSKTAISSSQSVVSSESESFFSEAVVTADVDAMVASRSGAAVIPVATSSIMTLVPVSTSSSTASAPVSASSSTALAQVSASSHAPVAPLVTVSKGVGKSRSTQAERRRVVSSNSSARSQTDDSKERIAALEKEVSEKLGLLKSVTAERDSLQNDVKTHQDRVRLLEASLAKHGIDPYTLRSVKVDDCLVEKKRLEMSRLVPDVTGLCESYQREFDEMLPSLQEITRRCHQAADSGSEAHEHNDSDSTASAAAQAAPASEVLETAMPQNTEFAESWAAGVAGSSAAIVELEEPTAAATELTQSSEGPVKLAEKSVVPVELAESSEGPMELAEPSVEPAELAESSAATANDDSVFENNDAVQSTDTLKDELELSSY